MAMQMTQAEVMELVEPELVFALAEGRSVLRQGLGLLLEKLFGCRVREFSTAEEVVEACRHGIDLALVDVDVPGGGGLWALEQLSDRAPALPVVVWATGVDAATVRRANELGARAFLLKDSTATQLREAISTALSGRGLYLHPAAAEALRPRAEPAGGVLDELSPREMTVLRLVAVGATNDEIARELFLSAKTVKFYLSAIFRKLGVANRTQAALTAVRSGLVDLGPEGRPSRPPVGSLQRS
jgi:DNA-binding NarL/FixJ family response regulator